MKLTKSEQQALGWIMENEGYKLEQIQHNPSKSPDFICSDEKRYEVKLLINGKLSFTKKQFKNFRPTDIIIVMDNRGFLDKFLWSEKEICKYKIENYQLNKKKILLKRLVSPFEERQFDTTIKSSGESLCFTVPNVTANVMGLKAKNLVTVKIKKIAEGLGEEGDLVSVRIKKEKRIKS